jgi:formate hydrogenlyase subunit 6/NADH:ubiquinone oxidoreductase subunit I
MEATKTSYWGAIGASARSLWTGLRITLRHIVNARKRVPHLSIADPAYFTHTEGIATIQFPHEMLPVPDTGRYRLHNEIDDCIVCDKCAKICPVNCITIEPIKSPEEIGKTSDGTPKRIYAAKFDIDMGKCCFCGLCTTVCPTECLTMTKVYDFSVFDIREHNFEFGEMTAVEITEKQQQWDDYQTKKKAAAPPAPAPAVTATAPAVSTAAATAADAAVAAPKPAGAKPVFKPKIKPPSSPAVTAAPAEGPAAPGPEPAATAVPAPADTPASADTAVTPASDTPAAAPKPAAPRPVFRPKIKPPSPPSSTPPAS